MKWYKFNVNDMSESEYNKFFDLMSEEKKGKVKRLKEIEDKKLSVCGEMLAKRAICDVTGKSSEEIVFERKKSGKPFCKNVDIEFSISHSGEYTVCALSNTPIGIDIQKVTPYNNKTAEKVCSAEEIERIDLSVDKAREFTKIWTKKEAVLKRDEKSIFSSDIKTCLLGETVKTIELEDYFVSIAE